MAVAKINSDDYSVGIVNPYAIRPRNLTQYTAYRGVTDFTQIGQFDQFESGYSFLSVIQMPTYLEELANRDSNVASMVHSFRHMLEYEFRGLTGLPDVQGETYTITDGINEMNLINRVTADTSITVQMSYYEKRGSLISRFCEYYLTGIKDRISQAKTYHGLIKNDVLEPGLENEVFTLLYYVTDNTMLRLERAYLLCNAQINKAETSMYDGTRSDINNREVTIEFNCFPVWGSQVDKAAKTLLEDITGVTVSNVSGSDNRVVKYTNTGTAGQYSVNKESGSSQSGTMAPAQLDSNDYLYGIMDTESADVIPGLADAYNGNSNSVDAISGASR